MKKLFLFHIALFMVLAGFAQQNQQRQAAIDYIAKYKDIAIAEMVKSKIPASITLAQGIHESSCGCSDLAIRSNNHFGIKCKSDWNGKSTLQNDDAPNECFRVYDQVADSYADHSLFLTTHPRYTPLFQLPITDYKSWAYGLKAAGYATNPKYPEILINTINLYQLDQYDQIGLAMIQGKTPPVNTASATAKKDTAMLAMQKPVHKIEKAAAIAQTPNLRTLFEVNGLKALKAEGEEDPLKIAMDYNIDYKRILSYNDLMDGEHFKDGEYIFMEPKKARGPEEFYTVERGESMHDISQKFGIKLAELYARNEMNFNENEQLNPGEQVYLKGKRPAAPRVISYAQFLKTRDADKGKATLSDKSTTGAIANPTQTGQYQVQPSDTLYSIAHKFNLSVEQLKAMNRLADTNLHPGQTLVVNQ
jgi:LysM repeat protein